MARLPDAVRAKCEDLLVDVVGLAVTARNEDYVKAALAAATMMGRAQRSATRARSLRPRACMVNGTAIHGEDFDDTFEGGPVHAGAVIVPAVLAACERHRLDGRAALLGIAVGVETMCRLSTVAPTLTHKAGFHPTAVFGAMGAAAGVGAALKLTPRQMVDALGTAASMASGHHRISGRGRVDQAAACRLGGAIGHCARRCSAAPAFPGPRTVFEGVHGFFHAFAHTTKGDYDALIGDFGEALGDGDACLQALSVRDHDASLHRLRAPARRAKKSRADDVVEMVCEVGEGTVHRLWEPLAAKQKPANGYAGKFSTPYCVAAGFVRGNVGLGDFSDAAVRDPQSSRSPARCATGSIRKIPIRKISPATSAPPCATARWSRSASPICAAARRSR